MLEEKSHEEMLENAKDNNIENEESETPVSDTVLVDALERQIKAIESLKGKKLTNQLAHSLVLIMKIVIVSINNRNKYNKTNNIYI